MVRRQRIGERWMGIKGRLPAPPAPSSSPRPTPPLLASPAALIGALCPHKVAHHTLPHCPHFHTGSQPASEYHKATLASLSDPDGGFLNNIKKTSNGIITTPM